jgi:hypothetical protein
MIEEKKHFNGHTNLLKLPHIQLVTKISIIIEHRLHMNVPSRVWAHVEQKKKGKKIIPTG